jgi:hypothetical protein
MTVRISSQKLEARNGRERHEFNGDLHSDKFGIVFSGSSLILNMKDGERRWTVILDEKSTSDLAARFANRA